MWEKVISREAFASKKKQSVVLGIILLRSISPCLASKALNKKVWIRKDYVVMIQIMEVFTDIKCVLLISDLRLGI